MKNSDPGQPDVVEGDGILERVAVARPTISVVLMPVDTRGIGGGVVAEWNSRIIACQPVEGEVRQVLTFCHALVVLTTADKISTIVDIIRWQDNSESKETKNTVRAIAGIFSIKSNSMKNGLVYIFSPV